jgi:hypothetical protein
MIFAVTLALITLVGSLPTAELVDDLDKAGEAEFVGRQLVVCWSADGVVADMVEVEQSHGMTMVVRPEGSVAIGEGKIIEQLADGAIRYLEMAPSSEWRLWDGYTVSEAPASGAGRTDARTVEIRQGDTLRARFALDAVTSAPLTTEVFNGDGALYRYSVMMELRPRGAGAMLDMEKMPEPEQLAAATPATLATTAGHYWAADSYLAPGGVQSFFTDGLFRFSVFELNRKSDGGGLTDAPPSEIGGRGGYHRLYTPGAVSVFWRTADRAYLLVGDLPPDHLESVLADLPTPARAGLLKRAWRWVFG